MYFDTDAEKWMILEVEMDGKTYHKVFATWDTFLPSHCWRVNSGIKKVNQDESYYYFSGYSGSCYRCHKSDYGVADAYCLGVLNAMLEGSLECVDMKMTALEDKGNWEDFLNLTF